MKLYSMKTKRRAPNLGRSHTYDPWDDVATYGELTGPRARIWCGDVMIIRLGAQENTNMDNGRSDDVGGTRDG